jgi:hypothetical protein
VVRSYRTTLLHQSQAARAVADLPRVHATCRALYTATAGPTDTTLASARQALFASRDQLFALTQSLAGSLAAVKAAFGEVDGAGEGDVDDAVFDKAVGALIPTVDPAAKDKVCVCWDLGACGGSRECVACVCVVFITHRDPSLFLSLRPLNALAAVSPWVCGAGVGGACPAAEAAGRQEGCPGALHRRLCRRGRPGCQAAGPQGRAAEGAGGCVGQGPCVLGQGNAASSLPSCSRFLLGPSCCSRVWHVLCRACVYFCHAALSVRPFLPLPSPAIDDQVKKLAEQKASIQRSVSETESAFKAQSASLDASNKGLSELVARAEAVRDFYFVGFARTWHCGCLTSSCFPCTAPFLVCTHTRRCPR